MSFLIDQSINSLWVIPIITNINLFLDSLIYMFAEYSYKLFELATAINFTDFRHGTAVLQGLMQRVMAFVTVFMLFRVAISIVQYLVNPDKFTDAQMGGTKIITNVFVVLALLGLVYSGLLFGLIGDFQTLIFSSGYKSENTFNVLPDEVFPATKNKNVIATLISGAETNEVNYGRSIAVAMLSSFLYLEEADKTIDPWTEYGRIENGSVNCGGLTYNKSVLCKIARTEEGSFLELTLLDTFWDSGDLWYYPIISGIAGFYIVFTFFKLTTQVLVRALKLFVLELISPIAIVALVDPNNGKTLFNRFWKTYFKIFVDLFMRVAFIYLAVVIIDIATKTILVPGATGGIFNESVGWFTILLLKAFLIFAVLKFIKTAPELISEVFGVKLDEKKGGFGKLLKGVAGAGIGLGMGLHSARAAGLGGGAAAFQGLTGAFQGGKAGASSQNMGDFIRNQVSTSKGIKGRSNEIAQVGGVRNRYLGGANRIKGQMETIDRHNQNLDAVLSANSADFARSNNQTTGRAWGTEQEYIDNSASVQRARQEEADYNNYISSLGTEAYDASGNLRQDLSDRRQELTAERVRAESFRKETYRDAANDYLRDALNGVDNGSNEGTRLAIEKLRRENPGAREIRVFQNDEGYSVNDANSIKASNAAEKERLSSRLNPEGVYRRREEYQRRNH